MNAERDSEPRPPGRSTADPEVLVVGAGPAGHSAVTWLETYAVPYAWVSRDGRVGGMLHRVENTITNYPGGHFDNGRQLAEQMARHLDEAGVPPPRAATVETLQGDEDRWIAEFQSGDTLRVPTVLLATGTQYRRLKVPGELGGLGDYVSQSTARDAERFGGRTVAVVGGGDAGFEGALQLARQGCHVHMLMRSPEFRARPQFVEPVRAHPRIFIQPIPTEVTRIEKLSRRRGCRLHLDVDGRSDALEVACVFVRIGVDPVLPDIAPTPEADAAGYLAVDDDHATSLDGLYAAGDITNPPLPAVATAVGAGADAARAIAEFLDRA